jgi:hypothetical protein
MFKFVRHLLAGDALGGLDVGDQILGRLDNPLVQVESPLPVSQHLQMKKMPSGIEELYKDDPSKIFCN